MTAHWGIVDPATVAGSAAQQERAFHELDARIKIFTSLRLELLDRLAQQQQLDAIGKIKGDETSPQGERPSQP